MKTRLRRKSAGKSTSIPWLRSSRFLTSYLDPPSPDEHDWPPPLPLSTDCDSTSIAPTVLTQWQQPSSTSCAYDLTTKSEKSQQVVTDFSQYRLTKLPIHDYALDPVTKSSTSARLPRFVPIVIPDFAQPQFARDLRSVVSESNLRNRRSSHSASATPTSQSYPPAVGLSDVAESTTPPRRPHIDEKLTPKARREQTTMNTSQVSLVASGASNDGAVGMSQTVNGAGSNIGISTSAPQQSPAPTNLSGLVCNVHRTTGEEPPPLVGATTTILGDKMYVFGGRIHSRTKPQLTSDLYELDLIRRHWARLNTVGDVPPPRYFHSVCGLGDSKLVCYGGMSPALHARNAVNGQGTKSGAEGQPEVVVMSDIHVFDVPSKQWMLISTSENPQGRYAHCAAILPSSAAFTSANAPLSAIQHNPSSSDPHSGTLGVQLDGTGGAEMVVVGGQDSSNNYIEQISVFNLRSLKWTNTTAWDRKCGAYKSMVSPMTGLSVDLLGRGVPLNDAQVQSTSRPGTAMLIYSNYNFLDVKLELQIRLPDGSMIEKPMTGTVSPPGLRFPNGGIIDSNFVVSGTYLTSSKHEYALWALDLKTLTWARIDTHGSIFSHGSWNRGILWNRRNTFVILGHRKRNLVDDYNHRRINFSHVCMVELEAFGLYDNPRREASTSGYVSNSAPAIPPSVQTSSTSLAAGGRPFNSAAEQLGQAMLTMTELSDMEIVALGGEKIPCNSYLLSKRWGPFFSQLVTETASTAQDTVSVSDGTTLRPSMRSQQSRNSSVTITPAVANGFSGSSASSDNILDPQSSLSRSTTRTLVDPMITVNVPSASRPRSLYLPHMAPTIHLLLHFLYTSSLPPPGSPMCTPHTLCSLLQMARPYQIDGLLEATVERLHEVLDGRSSAAVFNAAAMAAGGGRGLQGTAVSTLANLGRRASEATTIGDTLSNKTAGLKLATNYEEPGVGRKRGHAKTSSMDSASTATSASTSTDVSHTDTESPAQNENADSSGKDAREKEREMWTGDLSSVIGLQKRGLRGLMEGRRLRERANTGGE